MFVVPKVNLVLVASLLASIAASTVNAARPQFLFGPPTKLPEPINVPDYADVSPSLTADGLELYFHSWRDVDQTGENIYVSKRSSISEPFSTVSAAGLENINTEGDEFTPFISADGLDLYFVTSAERPSPRPLDFEGYDLWFTKRSSRNESFGVPQRITELSSDTVDQSISVSSDGLSAYFVRYDGLSDILVATRATKNDSWGIPVNLGPEINRDDTFENYVKISHDGLSLFFNSRDRSDTRGSVDTYVSTRASTSDPWLPAVNLGSTINTTQFDQSPFFSPERSELLFVRAEVDPNDSTRDIFQSTLLPFDYVSVPGSGGVYSQNFDALGTDSQTTGIAFPGGWTATANDVVFENATSVSFSPRRRGYAGYYNAGNSGDADRSLATSRTVASPTVASESGELDFRVQIEGQSAQAMRLSFDLEAWGTMSSTAASPGEAAFDVILEADTGNGFQQLMAVGSSSTGKTLPRPAQPGIVNGNDAAYRHSFDSGVRDIADIPAGAKLRFRWMQPETAASAGWILGLDNLRLVFAQAGDADADGLFNSTDLVQVFQAGEFEDGVAGNSSWSDGDWNGDKDFRSDDLVAAFQAGNYERAQGAVSVPEPSSWLLLAVAMVGVVSCRRSTLAPAVSR